MARLSIALVVLALSLTGCASLLRGAADAIDSPTGKDVGSGVFGAVSTMLTGNPTLGTLLFGALAGGAATETTRVGGKKVIRAVRRRRQTPPLQVTNTWGVTDMPSPSTSTEEPTNA